MASTTIEAALATYMLAQSSLTDLVGRRVYYINAPQDAGETKLPYITYRTLLADNYPDTFENLDYGSPRMQIHVIVNRDQIATGLSICDVLITLFQRYQGDMDGVTIRYCFIHGPRESKSTELDDRYEYIMELEIEYVRP